MPAKSYANERPGFKPGPIPKEAIAWLKGKGVKPTESWKDAWGQEHRYAFYVAKIMERGVLKDVQASLEGALDEGVPFDEWKKAIAPAFDSSGWADYNGEAEDNPSRLRTVYDTNMRTARMAGQLERQERVKDMFPYAQLVLGPSKIHRDAHLAWEGIVVRVDGEFFQTHVTPMGWGCKCSWLFCTQAQVDAMGVDVAEPDFEMVDWEDGEGNVTQAPEGVMPGFGQNPLIAREQSLQELADGDE